jgi:hypothetical protein
MPKQRTTKKAPAKNAGTPQLFTFEVALISGPLSEKFIKKNPVVARTIEMPGNQTFADLHEAFFDAYDREDEHMYEFQFGGRGPNEPDARCYVSDPENADAAGYVGDTRIDAVGLQAEEAFGYWFDYGDDWWHQVNLVSISPDVPKGTYPNVTEKVGASPPQYPEDL